MGKHGFSHQNSGAVGISLSHRRNLKLDLFGYAGMNFGPLWLQPLRLFLYIII
jgi:hypothetical protein